MPTNAPENNDAPEPRNLWLLVLGILLGIGGGAVILGPRYGYLTAGDTTTYTGMGLIIAGMASSYISGLPRDKAIEWVKSAVFALMLALTIRWAVAEPYRIPSGSMEPTLHGDESPLKGDRVFVNKWIYGLRWPFLNSRIFEGWAPQRWDIVVFKTVEPDAIHPTLVKRIVGLPGEHINIRDGKVFVNGEALEIPDFMPDNMYYTSEEMRSMKYGVRPEEEFSVVPEGHYLMLGDNSANSKDGRYFGWLPEEHMVGRVACIWWPLNRCRDFTGFTSTLWWRGLMGSLAVLLFFRLFIGQSWPVIMDSSRKVQHIYVSFTAIGLRIPFLGIWMMVWNTPKRGELVLYRSSDPRVPRDALLFGRVAGLPGEHVEIEDGALRVNGKPAPLPCWPESMSYEHNDSQAAYGKKKKHTDVPDGHYFLLADPPNETDAYDSRLLGWVPARDVLGVATYVWWPFASCRRL